VTDGLVWWGVLAVATVVYEDGSWWRAAALGVGGLALDIALEDWYSPRSSVTRAAIRAVLGAIVLVVAYSI
jgi:hypothetical protein